MSQSQFMLRCNPMQADPAYVAYFFGGPMGQHLLLENRSQVGVPAIARPVTTLRTLKIPLPPLNEQRGIASILGSLDDKIELNRSMSRTLAGIVQATFDQWFVVEEGQPLPSGWRTAPIGEVLVVRGGTTPSTDFPEFWDGECLFCTPKDMSALGTTVLLDTERHVTELGLGRTGSGLLPAGTVLMSSRAPIGYLAIAERATAVNQGIIAMVCEGELSNHYALCWARRNQSAVLARANGSTFLEISKGSFKKIPIVVPSKRALKPFDTIADSAYRRIAVIEAQSRSLRAVRKLLSPRLLDGTLAVAEE